MDLTDTPAPGVPPNYSWSKKPGMAHGWELAQGGRVLVTVAPDGGGGWGWYSPGGRSGEGNGWSVEEAQAAAVRWIKGVLVRGGVVGGAPVVGGKA